MDELKTIWSSNRLITAWEVEGRYEVTVLDANVLAYLEGYGRCFSDPEAAVDYCTEIAHYFEQARNGRKTPPRMS